MAKCPVCGKFAPADGAKCSSCGSTYHRQCVHMKADGRLPAKWCCKTCKHKPAPSTTPPTSNSTSPDSDCSDSTAISEAQNRDPNIGQELKLIRVQLSNIVEGMTGCRQEMETFRQEVLKLNSTVAEFNNRLNAVEGKLNNITKRLSDAESKIGAGPGIDVASEIERRLNDRDQEAYANDVEIAGIEEETNENPVHLASLVAKKVGVNFEERDVVFVSRSGKVPGHSLGAAPRRPRVLLVRFTRRALRDQLLAAARSRRGTDTTGIVGTEPRQIYINERLTWFNRRLFLRARQEARARGWRYVWIRDGRIYARRAPDAPAVRLRTDMDIERILGSKNEQ